MSSGRTKIMDHNDSLRLGLVIVSLVVSWSGLVSSVHGHNSLSSFNKAQWPNHGGGVANRREAPRERIITPSTASTFHRKWRVKTGGDVSVTPSIADGVVYFATWGGEVYAVSEREGHVLWRRNLTVEMGSERFLHSRNTPVAHGQYLLVGIYIPALQVALDRRSGRVVWSTLVDAHPYAGIAVSGTVFEGYYYIGVTSLEEENLNQPCCTFQGSAVKMDVATGKVAWQTRMLTDNEGVIDRYAGAAIWGSSPPIDARRRHVYVATGNLYDAPPDVLACQAEQDNKTTPDIPNPCISPDDHSESILALDLDSGKIVWSRHLGKVDVWNVACIPGLAPGGPDNCPDQPGDDYDFGEAPMLLRVKNSGAWRDIVVAGQKSGFVWALNRDDGALVWDAIAGPGGDLGGASWGSSTDGKRVYTSIINNFNRNFTLAPSSTVINAGGWVAMDAATGTILWSTATPKASYPIGPVTVANGVLFGTSLGDFQGAPRGAVHALDAKSGTLLWSEEVFANASVAGGVSVHDGCFFVGEGITPITATTYPAAAHGHAVNAMCVVK